MKSELKLISRSDPIALNRFLLHDASLELIPTTLSSLMRTKIPLRALNSVLRDLSSPRRNQNLAEESAHDFFSRRFDASVSKYLVSSFVNGIYGGDVKLWSMRWLFPKLLEYEQNHRSVLVGMFRASNSKLSSASSDYADFAAFLMKHAFISFEHGMQRLCDALVAHLSTQCSNVNLHLNAPCINIEKSTSLTSCVEVHTPAHHHHFSHLFCTAPAPALANAVTSSTLKHALNSVHFSSFAVVNFVFDDMKAPENFYHTLGKKVSIGYLVPQHAHASILGVIFDSWLFPERCSTGFNISVISKFSGDLKNSLETIETSLNHLRSIFGDSLQPSYQHIHSCPNCIPQYTTQYSQKLDQITSITRELFDDQVTLTGASYGSGIGVPDCILSSRQSVLKWMEKHVDGGK